MPATWRRAALNPRIEDAARQENRVPLRHCGRCPTLPRVNRLLRIALACLLVIALPAKGLAAASMVFCGAVDHGTAGIAAQHDHAGHGQGGHDPTGHAHAGHADMTAEGGSTGTPPGHDGMEHPTAKCSVCASCCSVAALGSMALDVRVVPPGREYAAVAAVPRPGVTVGGLERPPRSFLA